jgi:hypothetical protein
MNGRKIYRAIGDTETASSGESFADPKTLLVLTRQNGQILSSFDPLTLMSVLIGYAESNCVEYEVSDNKWKVRIFYLNFSGSTSI